MTSVACLSAVLLAATGCTTNSGSQSQPLEPLPTTFTPAPAFKRLVPADPSTSFLGPTAATGAVIWSHGRSASGEDSVAPTPPYIQVLQDGGWDSFRFERRRDGDRLPDSGAALARIAHRLKMEGYRKVALAGQSFGAFISLIAAGLSDDVDAVIGTAPAAFGDTSDDTFGLNASELYRHLNQVHHARIALAFFHGDTFDPGGRGERTHDILKSRHLGNIVIDQPSQLDSHWAAGTKAFAARFGACLLEFLNADRIGPDAACQANHLWAGTPDKQPATAPKASQVTQQTHVAPAMPSADGHSLAP